MKLIIDETNDKLSYDKYIDMRNNNKYLSRTVLTEEPRTVLTGGSRTILTEGSGTILTEGSRINDITNFSDNSAIMKKLKNSYNLTEALEESKYLRVKNGKHCWPRFRKKVRRVIFGSHSFKLQ